MEFILLGFSIYILIAIKSVKISLKSGLKVELALILIWNMSEK